MALASLSALIQTRKMSENNVAQETAAVIAQGIIEQVQLNPYDDIKDNTSGLHPNLALKFTGSNANNLASIQQYDLPWALDSTTFTDIGARSDPTDPASPIVGVLIDLDYKVGTQVIRPRRYMKMQVNITRNVHVADDNIEVILTYSWQPPTGNGAANARYLSREIRTIRSEASSY